MRRICPSAWVKPQLPSAAGRRGQPRGAAAALASSTGLWVRQVAAGHRPCTWELLWSEFVGLKAWERGS